MADWSQGPWDGVRLDGLMVTIGCSRLVLTRYYVSWYWMVTSDFVRYHYPYGRVNLFLSVPR